MKSTLIILITASLLSTGCIDFGERVNGNGNVTTEKRNIQNAEKIRVTGSMDVILESGESGVRIEADENIIPYIATNMDDGWLDIGTKDNVNINTNNPIRVYVTSPAYNHITLTGSGDVSTKEEIRSDKPVSLSLTGSGDITTTVNAPSVKAGVTGSGNINISGQTKEADVSVTGSGDFKGSGLSADDAKVNIAGSGNIFITANKSLNADILGSGDVKYKGNASIQKNVAGSGSVIKVE